MDVLFVNGFSSIYQNIFNEDLYFQQSSFDLNSLAFASEISCKTIQQYTKNVSTDSRHI